MSPPKISLFNYALGYGPSIKELRAAYKLPRNSPAGKSNKAKNKTGKNKPDEEKKDGADNNPHGFTAAEDAKIVKLKTAKPGMPWAEVEKEVGRPGKVCQERYRALKGKASGNDKKEGENGKGGAGDKQGDEKGKGGSEKGKAAGSRNVLMPDSTFNADELQIMCDILKVVQENLWARAASKFFDRTGRRVHPDELRKKFGETK